MRSVAARAAARAVVLGAALASLAGGGADAHERTTSHSTWSIHGREAHVTVRLSRLDVSRFPWGAAESEALERALATYVSARLQLLAGETPCAIAAAPRSLATVPGRLAVEWRLRCPTEGGLRIRSALLLDVAPAHLHFARVRREGAEAGEQVLSERAPAWALGAAAAGADGTAATSYLVFGIEHILTGWDHLAFLVALLLIGSSFARVATVVTGFTVAHSITLGLAVLGYVRPEAAPVEALVGLSIAVVAVENVWLVGGRSRLLPGVVAGALALLALAAAAGYGSVPALTLGGLALFSHCHFALLRRVGAAERLRWSIAFIFGLVHGFAFAAVLAEAQLPPARLATALLGFNLGVELGQLGVVAALWPLLRLAARHRLRPLMIEAGSTAVLALGLFWFVTRAFG